MNSRTWILFVAVLTPALVMGQARADQLPTVQVPILKAKFPTSKSKPHRSHPPTAGQHARDPRASDFADLIKTLVRERGAELCTRYGGDPDCIEEIEVCFSMLDKDDDLMKICLNTAPERGEPNETVKTRLRRKSILN